MNFPEKLAKNQLFVFGAIITVIGLSQEYLKHDPIPSDFLTTTTGEYIDIFFGNLFILGGTALVLIGFYQVFKEWRK